MEIEKGKNISYPKKDPKEYILPVPDDWLDESFSLDPAIAYTISQQVNINEGISTFGSKPMKISIKPLEESTPNFSLNGDRTRLDIKNTSNGKNNIKLRNIAIIEHPLALMTALNLDFDIDISESSFPTFDKCNKVFLDAIREFIIPNENKNIEFVTVKEPVAIKFPNGGYFIVEPDDGKKKLILDHQILYPGKAIGKQRIIAEMTPEFFAFISEARTVGFGLRSEVAKLLRFLKFKKSPYLACTFDNVLFANKYEILNSNSKFDYKDVNYELILHELMDKIAVLKFIDGKFVGTIRTYLTNHDGDLEFPRAVRRGAIETILVK